MKKVLLLSLLVILFSSCRVPDSVMAGYEENPFLDRVRVETDNCDIVFFTDSHIGRDKIERLTRIVRSESSFFAL